MNVCRNSAKKDSWYKELCLANKMNSESDRKILTLRSTEQPKALLEILGSLVKCYPPTHLRFANQAAVGDTIKISRRDSKT